MKTLKIMALATLMALPATTTTYADDANIETRQSVMRTVKAAIKVSAAMAKGEMDYDPVKATLAMNVFYAAAVGFPNYFTVDDSDDLDTEAGPKIWQDMAGFKKATMTFRNDAAMAIKKANEGPEQFKAVFGKVAGNCKACHDAYRVKKK